MVTVNAREEGKMNVRDIDDETLIALFDYAQDDAQLDAIEAEIERRGIYGRRRAN